ncbi:MAG TPA: hypothetical protein VKV19_01090 [Ktedonobacteraceae bacterium]|jgi:hypothetical protein|nr:hypothetical protein [Ktedonobacteraceae bacterium]
MDRKDDREILRKGGFAEGEVQRLSKLRQDYAERERLREVVDKRRLEFIRWLVTNGRLSEQIAS